MPYSKEKIQAVLSAAEAALAEGVARVALFDNAEDFKRSLLQALDVHAGFSDKTRLLHAHAMAAPPSKSSQVPRQVVPSGRMQAPRCDKGTPAGKRSKRS